jgi:hypothetical protein
MAIDAAAAVQQAVFGALSVPALTGMATVTQHVRQSEQPPLVVIGAITLDPQGGKDGGLDQARFDVLTYVREPGRAPLYARMNIVREMLDGVKIIAPAGVSLTEPVLESQADDLLEDGQTYEGTQTFSLFVQPA